MKARAILPFVLAMGVYTLLAGSGTVGPAASDTEVIRFGAGRSSLIISGQIMGSRGGGGGATATVKVDEVLKAPAGFQAPKSIAVYYLSAKEPFIASRDRVSYTNVYLFFLRPATTNAQTGYHDVTDKNHPLVRATEKNMVFLRSQLEEKK